MPAEARDDREGARDDWSAHWARYADSARENPAQDMRHRLVLAEIRGLGPVEVLLDVGSGQGDFLGKASSERLAGSLIGFELSRSGVEISRRAVAGAVFHQVDMYRPPESAARVLGCADVAVCSDVIEHVDDPVELLRQVRRYLKPGGCLVLTVPAGPMSAFDRHIGHRTHYTRATAATVLSAAGFTIEKVALAGFPFFNLYRIVVLLRGKRLIADVSADQMHDGRGGIAKLAMRAFHFLFRFNLPNTPFGWQLLAVARSPLPAPLPVRPPQRAEPLSRPAIAGRREA